MQSLAIRKDDWTPPIVKTVATEGKGIPELLAAIEHYQQHLKQNQLSQKKKISNWRERLIEMLRQSLLERVLREQVNDDQIGRWAQQVSEHRRDPYTLVEEIVSKVGK
jgi:LAO/AO transport system kinase